MGKYIIMASRNDGTFQGETAASPESSARGLKMTRSIEDPVRVGVRKGEARGRGQDAYSTDVEIHDHVGGTSVKGNVYLFPGVGKPANLGDRHGWKNSGGREGDAPNRTNPKQCLFVCNESLTDFLQKEGRLGRSQPELGEDLDVCLEKDSWRKSMGK